MTDGGAGDPRQRLVNVECADIVGIHSAGSFLDDVPSVVDELICRFGAIEALSMFSVTDSRMESRYKMFGQFFVRLETPASGQLK